MCPQVLVEPSSGGLFPFVREGQALLTNDRSLSRPLIGEDRVPALQCSRGQDEVEFLQRRIEAATNDDERPLSGSLMMQFSPPICSRRIAVQPPKMLLGILA